MTMTKINLRTKIKLKRCFLKTEYTNILGKFNNMLKIWNDTDKVELKERIILKTYFVKFDVQFT